MLLKRIHVKRFGCLEDFATEFHPGLNVIRGPNESGKSTLHQALLLALGAQPSQTQKTGNWVRWGSERWYELELDFADATGRTYRIAKDFHSGAQSIVLPKGETTKGRDKVEKVLNEVLGTTSMVVLKSTLCVEQDALSEIADGRREISESLETILTGSEDDVHTEKALKRLEKYVTDYRKGLNRHAAQPGPLVKTREDVVRRQRHAQEVQAQILARAAEEHELAEVEARLVEIDRESRPLIETGQQVSRWQKTQADLKLWREQERALEAKVEQIADAQAKRVTTAAQLASVGALANLTDDNKRSIDALAGRLDTLREERTRHSAAIHQYETELANFQEQEASHARARATYEAELASYDEEQAKYQAQLAAYRAAQEEYGEQVREYEQQVAVYRLPEPAGSPVSAYLWAVLLGVGVVAAVAGVLSLVLAAKVALGVAALVGGLLLAAIGLWLRAQATTVAPPLAVGHGGVAGDASNLKMARPVPPSVALPPAPTSLRPEPPALPPAAPNKPQFDEQSLHAAEAQLHTILATLNCQTVDDLNAKYAQVVALRGEMAISRSRLDALLGTDTLNELEQQRREASRKRRDAEEILQDPAMQRVSTMDQLAINQLVARAKSLEAEQTELRTKQQRLAIRLEQRPVSKEDWLRAEEALEAAKTAHERARQQDEVLALTCEVMKQARERTLKRAQEQLGPVTVGYLSAITNGRYQQAWIDSDLNIELQVPDEPERRIRPDRLSRGARDQLYLAARLALVDLLFPRTRPPVLLDDPFVHFDPQRLEAAIAICCQVAQERQLLLFTCSDHYNHVGHHIVMA